MKLYYVPLTRASRPRWMLEELGVPYELVRIDRAWTKSREYLAIHPLGHVPAFTDGDLTMFESAAIVSYLADKYPDKQLAPPPGTPERGLYYQWMFFVMATMEPPLVAVFNEQVKKPEPERDQKVIAAARARFTQILDVLDGALAGKEYILGDRFSAADIMIASALAWSKFMGLLDHHPRVQAYSKRMADRPAAKRARAD
jgi:glutathione S-transferase